MKYLLSFLIITACLASYSQNARLYRTIYYPAEPYGGEKEFKKFVKRELVYPDSAQKHNIEGEVFITFKIDNKANVVFKEIADNTPLILRKEASRIFDKIVWEKDTTRSNPDIGFEKLSIDFNLKKYGKLVKKRGYDALPNAINPYEYSELFYSINQVDEKPQFNATENFNKFIQDNFKYPNIALQQGISGRVTVEFIIEPDVLATNIRVKEAVGGGCNEETMRLVRLMSWKPAKKDGKLVRCHYEYQLNFVNPGGSIR